jgi:hypothetical protein
VPSAAWFLSVSSPEAELRIWKRVVRGALGEKVYATLETIVKRELAKEVSEHA